MRINIENSHGYRKRRTLALTVVSSAYLLSMKDFSPLRSPCYSGTMGDSVALNLTMVAIKQEVVKPDVLKPDVLKPEVVKPEVVKQEVVDSSTGGGGGGMEVMATDSNRTTPVSNVK